VRMKKTLTLVVLFGLASLASSAEKGELFVGATSTQPAKRFQQAFLSGNGTMGVMMFGNPYDEQVTLNHCRMFLPRGTREVVHDLADSMPEIKAAGLKAGKYGPQVVHQLTQEKTGHSGKSVPTDPYHLAFRLNLQMAARSSAWDRYVMTENFETGELAVRWSDENGDWARKLFVSRPDNVAVMAVSGPKGKVGGTFSMDIDNEGVEPEVTAADGCLSAHVVYTRGKGGYDCLIRVVADGGETRFKDGQALVAGADRVLLIMQVRPWRTPLPKEQSEAWAYSPENPHFGPGHKTSYLADMREQLGRLPADYDALFNPHAKIHGELFSRVKLDLHGGADRSASSEALLSRAAEEGRMSPALMERMYDACRYLIICSTGELPPNLVGIWTDAWATPWDGTFTIDSNLQLASQSLLSCGMPELMEGYFNLIESWLPDCRLNARKFYGYRGIVPRSRSSNECLMLHWGKWPGEMTYSAMGWLAHFFYDYYQFTGDREFLEKRAVPLLKETVLFLEDMLAGTEDENGKYRFFMSFSPEQKELIANATYDIAVSKAVLTYLIKSCETLDIEEENVKKWKEMLRKMPPYLINDRGELQEWAWPGADENHGHRHHSQFLPLYQFCEIDRDRTPDLWKAAGTAFENKFEVLRQHKQGNITHGVMNQGQCAARLGRSDIVHDVLSRIATGYLYPSFMIGFFPGPKGFGFDPVGTIPDIVNNSLVFVWEDTLDLIPALPEEWPRGSIRGVLARGQIKIDRLAWDIPAGKLDLTLTSAVAPTLKARLPSSCRMDSMQVVTGKATVKEITGKPDCRELALPAGESVSLVVKISK